VRNKPDRLPADGRPVSSESTSKLRRCLFETSAGPYCPHAAHAAFRGFFTASLKIIADAQETFLFYLRAAGKITPLRWEITYLSPLKRHHLK
jgi:hypothetical protein